MVNCYYSNKPFLYLTIILSTLSKHTIQYSLRSGSISTMNNKKTSATISTKSIKSFFTSSTTTNSSKNLNNNEGDSIVINDNHINDPYETMSHQITKKAKLEHEYEATLFHVDGNIFVAEQQQVEVSNVDDNRDHHSPYYILEKGTTNTTASSNSSSSLCQWKPFDEMEIGWRTSLISETNKPYFKSLLSFLNTEIKSGKTIYPPAKDIFTAFNLCPLDKVKVVIIGQDPYHGAGQAHGLAFSVGKDIQIPPSLKNIITEAKNDPGINITQTSSHGNLICWAKQGVLMLNTVLTVRKGEANSHQKKGWEEFTDAVVRELNKKNNIVYLLWGNPAQNKCKCINTSRNTLIKASHPSPLGAYKTNEPFMGSRCFSRCNEALVKYNQAPIDWNIT